MAAAVLWSGGCSHGGPQPADEVVEVPAGADCVVIEPGSSPGDSLVVGLIQPLDPAHAPAPFNRGERLVFRQLYQNLVSVDCRGKIQSALARSWSSQQNGRVWFFDLDSKARFWDGAPVTAEDVAACWRATAGRAPVEGTFSPWPWILPDSLRALSPGRLRVALTQGIGRRPVFFAHPDLAVAKPGPGAWPIGSGGYVVDETTPGRLRVAARTSAGNRRALVFISVGTGDARDLVPMGADLFCTRDPETMDYVGAKTELTSMFLGWDRTYVLASPHLYAAATKRGDHLVFGDFRRNLVRDALAADVREERDAGSFVDLSSRARDLLPPETEGASSPDAPKTRIVYPQDDPEAQRLAERLVALALSREKGESTDVDGVLKDVLNAVFPKALAVELGAAPLSGEAFRRSLHQGSDRAYLIPVERGFPDAALETAAFHASIPWLHRASVSGQEENGGATVLMTTGTRLVWRRGCGGVAAAWDGTLRFDESLWEREPVP